ncbi:hypothetical protein Plec18167_000045 [Paecilomyces lecythidis]|uniref:Arb2 domain-containing protein n=1 Tax=Paecilomyces lecythidis TaxID=3004212 RepID=A0ABR3YCT0_9EURO
MFVFRREDLPTDPVFPADLKKLGYFINDNDQIRKISEPEKEFVFKINRNDRWNMLNREAMNACIRSIVLSRLRDLGLSTLRLPLSAGPDDRHVPIMASSNLKTASHVIVVFGEPVQDLGIWAYRTIGSEGIDAGSAVAFAKSVLGYNNPEDKEDRKVDTALILANAGQLVWYNAGGRAITQTSWLALPKESAVDPLPRMTHRNKIPRNGNWEEHVQCVFEDVLKSRGHLLSENAKIDIIGLAEGGLAAVTYLADNWSDWSSHISAICLANPLHYNGIHIFPESSSSATENSFENFVSSRCRAYVLSNRSLGDPVPGAVDHGCNCYASGEELNVECIMPKAWKSMLEWLEKAHDDPTFGEVQLVLKDDLEDDTEAVDSEAKGDEE